ncbi:MAG: damage-control phosphatase ARMT1 family protein [Blautia sp.]
MKINAFCMSCLVQAQARRIQKFQDEEKKACYMREVLHMIAESDPKWSAPALLEPISKLYEKYWGMQNDLEEEKKTFNELLLSMEDDLEQKIRSRKDPLEAALCLARLGNYIDFSALGEVSAEKLLELLAQAEQETLDTAEYRHFCKDLKDGKHLVYLTDNCGEIVLDKILIKLLREQYPQLMIEVVVRGVAVTNDATMEDARYVGLTEVAPVFGNGSGIAGTELTHISKEAKEKLEQADLILSKGQGNFETLHTCGLNIYYLFLCKCDWFMQRFHAEHLKGMFVNETRI